MFNAAHPLHNTLAPLCRHAQITRDRLLVRKGTSLRDQQISLLLLLSSLLSSSSTSAFALRAPTTPSVPRRQCRWCSRSLDLIWRSDLLITREREREKGSRASIACTREGKIDHLLAVAQAAAARPLAARVGPAVELSVVAYFIQGSVSLDRDRRIEVIVNISPW